MPSLNFFEQNLKCNLCVYKCRFAFVNLFQLFRIFLDYPQYVWNTIVKVNSKTDYYLSKFHKISPQRFSSVWFLRRESEQTVCVFCNCVFLDFEFRAEQCSIDWDPNLASATKRICSAKYWCHYFLRLSFSDCFVLFRVAIRGNYGGIRVDQQRNRCHHCHLIQYYDLMFSYLSPSFEGQL